MTLLLLLACAGTAPSDTDADTDTDTDADSDTDSDADTDVVDTGPFADIDAILSDACYPCHTADDAGGWAYTGFDSLVDVPSSQSSLDRIEPSSRDESYIWHKVSGTHATVGGSGQKMPIGGGLTSTNRETLGVWIDEGAPR